MKEERYNLYWGEINEQESLKLLFEDLTLDEVKEKILIDLKLREEPYVRLGAWKKNNQFVFDYGSCDYFYLAREVDDGEKE